MSEFLHLLVIVSENDQQRSTTNRKKDCIAVLKIIFLLMTCLFVLFLVLACSVEVIHWYKKSKISHTQETFNTKTNG